MDEIRPMKDPREERIGGLLDLYIRSFSFVFLLLGLWHWAVIIGVITDAGMSFEAMPIEHKLTTINLGVADLVAGVGMWMRVAWGNVVWVYAALFEVAMHTVFRSTFGDHYPLVGFHLATLAVLGTLALLERRSRRRV
jgi:hypothetical protein